MKTIEVHRAIGGAVVELPVASPPPYLLEDGPHGGAVLIYAGQRIGLVETREAIHRLLEAAEEAF